MTIEQFIYLNFAMLTLISIIFLWGRRDSRNPSKLKLTPPEIPLSKNLDTYFHNSQNIKNHINENFQSDQAKDLNPLFMYNGHSWDAFEVLGVPPGSSMEQIKKAFEESLTKTDSNSHEFLKTALTTILSEMKKQGYQP